VGLSGQVTFNSISTGTNAFTSYLWHFGDGTSGNGANLTHSYINGGTHFVTLAIADSMGMCGDSITQAINITGVACHCKR